MIPDHLTFAAVFTALGWAVLHLLWQGAFIGLLAAVSLAGLRERSAAARYAVACAALACCLMAFIVTFALMAPPSGAAPGILPGLDQVDDMLAGGAGPNRLIETLAWLWVAGVLLGAVRFIRQWVAVHRLKTISTSEPGAHWQRVFDALRDELSVSRGVRLLRSGIAETPMVVGWLAPVVLVPVSAFTSLSPEQLRSILAHELAHIRRCDHLVNAAQVVVETILFFHPVVWWLSKQARLEREHCCDDAAVRTAGHPRIFAEALAQLESLRPTHPRAALAANGGPLMNRITRILAASSSPRSNAPRWQTVAALAAAAVMTAAGLAHATALGNTLFDPPTEAEIDAWLETVVAKLQEGIEAGAISAQAANAKLDAVSARLGRAGKASDALDPRITHLKAAVESGGITARDAEMEMKMAAMYNQAAAHVAQKRQLEAAAAELHAAVKAGKLSPADAELKLAALHQARSAKARLAIDLDVMAAELHAAVQAGKLSPEDAEAKLVSLHQAHAVKARLANDVDVMAAELHAAVQAGALSSEEAQSRFTALHRAHADQVAVTRNLDVAAAELHAAVQAGILSPQDAKAKIAAIQHAQSAKARLANDLEVVAAQLHAAVQAGQLSSEDAKTRMAAIHKAAAENDRSATILEIARFRLEGDVKSGKITANQAEAELATFKRSKAGKPDLDASMKNLLNQLRAEVKSGTMTVEQAQAALEALKADLGKTEDQ